MIGRRARTLLAASLAIIALISWHAGLGSPVLCVHADGGSALETGSDSCCLPAAQREPSSASSIILTADSGGCPGCTDLHLTWAARQPPRSNFAGSSTLAMAPAFPVPFVPADGRPISGPAPANPGTGPGQARSRPLRV